MARKGVVIKSEAKNLRAVVKIQTEKATPTLTQVSSPSSVAGSRKENQSSHSSQAGKRQKPSPGVTITHKDAVGENEDSAPIVPAPAGYPSWFYPAVNQIVAPLISKISELERRVSDLDARQLDSDARFSDHKTMFIARYGINLLLRTFRFESLFFHSELRTSKEVAELRDQFSSSIDSAPKSSMAAEPESQDSKSIGIPPTSESKTTVIQNPEKESQTLF